MVGVENHVTFTVGNIEHVHERAAIREVCLIDDEVEVGDDLDDGEQRVMAIDAVYLDHHGVVGGPCTN